MRVVPSTVGAARATAACERMRITASARQRRIFAVFIVLSNGGITSIRKRQCLKDSGPTNHNNYARSTAGILAVFVKIPSFL
jgi:hypothetical protein